MKDKSYLGDSVYAGYDGYHLVLTTENGSGPSNTIYLDPIVFANMTVFAVKIGFMKAKEELGEK